MVAANRKCHDSSRRDVDGRRDYVAASGVYPPTKRRAYTRGPGHRPILEMLMESIDISEVLFEQRDHMGGSLWAPYRKSL
jgi:hypothetical protein